MALNSVRMVKSTVDGCIEAYLECGDCHRFVESDTKDVSISVGLSYEDSFNEDAWYDATAGFLKDAEDDLDEYDCSHCGADEEEGEEMRDSAWDKNWEDLGSPV